MPNIRLIVTKGAGDTIFYARFIASDGASAYTEESRYTRSGTFGTGAAINSESLDLTLGTGYVTFGGIQNLNVAAAIPFTVDFTLWLSSYSLSSTRYVIGQYDATNNQRAWAVTQNGDQLRVIWSTNGTGFTTLVAITTLSAIVPLNTATNMRIDYDGANVRFYVNGVMTAKAALAARFFASTAPLALGIRSDLAAGTEWQGRLDDVRIIRGKALTASDAGYSVPMRRFLMSGITEPLMLADGTRVLVRL